MSVTSHSGSGVSPSRHTVRVMPLERLALARSTLDRAAERRTDPELRAKLVADPGTLVAAVVSGRAPVAEGSRLLLSGPGDHPGLLEGTTVFLGEDGDGRSYLAHAVPEEYELPDGADWADLRAVGSVLDDTGAGIMTTAVAILAWHAAHGHCANCGHATDVILAGWERHCPNCGRTHYPRTDPAVIMAIEDADERILLGRQAVWPEKRFSTLAGFVEPGEALEDAVRREVAEESGVVVGAVEYLGSQPWPFPSSLMLGFRGVATSTALRADGTELADVRWWGREELQADIRAGELLLPPGLSIARRLIEHWYGGEIEGATEAWR
jgi:NAD+ diphosphatase